MINPSAYDVLVTQSPQGSIYCRHWWLEAVAPGQWNVLAVERGQELAAAWPIVVVQDGNTKRLTMPPLTQKLGMMYAPMTSRYCEQLSREHELAGELIEMLPDVNSFEHRFHERFTNWLPFYWKGYSQTTRYTYLLDIEQDVDKLWENMRGKCRRRIRKAQKNDLRVVDDIELDELLALNDQTFSRQGLDAPFPHALIRRIDEACSNNAGRKIIAARDSDDRLHAGVYFVWDSRTAYYLLGGSDPSLRGSGAWSLIMWEGIKQLRDVADKLDLEGSMIPNIESAFRSLGGHQFPFSVISKRPSSGSIPQRALRAVRKVIDR